MPSLRFYQTLMATSYQTDRRFTERIHRYVALPLVYQPMGWSPFRLTSQEMYLLDRDQGIDRIFYTSEGYLVSVQERFRAGKYAQKYRDVTLRYQRVHNAHPSRHHSEFFKIKADYLLYGVIDGSKEDASIVAFQRVALLHLPGLMRRIAQGDIVIDESRTGKSCWEGDRMIVPVNHNTDSSSSFVALSVAQLQEKWGQEIVVRQTGTW